MLRVKRHLPLTQAHTQKHLSPPLDTGQLCLPLLFVGGLCCRSHLESFPGQMVQKSLYAHPQLYPAKVTRCTCTLWKKLIFIYKPGAHTQSSATRNKVCKSCAASEIPVKKQRRLVPPVAASENLRMLSEDQYVATQSKDCPTALKQSGLYI